MDTNPLSPVKRALQAVDAMQARLAAAEYARREPIAIVGVGCRFPGGVTDAASYWRLLTGGVDAIGEVPRNRWSLAEYFDADAEAPGKIYTRHGGFVDGLEDFDAHFFHISPREARSLDPQHRLLLEVSWEALEDACIAPLSLHGEAAGVFLGLCSNDYERLLSTRGVEEIDAYLATGNTHSMAAGRISYLLGLQGPAVSVDTACSSALAAVHLAMQSLRAGECDVALAGAANCILIPDYSINFCKSRMLSADGRCKTFDARADGFVRGEGAGAIVLKRLSDAQRSRDRILAVLRGSAMNQDGHTSGPTAPSGPAQQAVIRRALANAGVTPHQVGYLETHGTGTSLGDPIEAAALDAVFAPDRPAGQPLVAGSVKTNIGHLEGAAGIAGLIKAALSVSHGVIPKNLHFETPSPHIDWTRTCLKVPTKQRQWPPNQPRIAGVSSFGFSGTNVHVIVEQPPPAEPVISPRREWSVLALSARTESALAEMVARASAAMPEEWEDAAYSWNAGRSHFEYRIAVAARNSEEAKRNLASAVTAHIPEGAAFRAAFVFADGNEDFSGVQRELYAVQPAFRAAIEECAALRAKLQLADSPRLALFAYQIAWAQMWRSWGIRPEAAAGQGTGAIAALCASGAIGLEEGLRRVSQGDSGGDFAARWEAVCATRPTVIVEIGPGRLPDLQAAGATLVPPPSGAGLWRTLADGLCTLYLAGADVDWEAWDRGFHRRKLPLPTYPFQRKRHWYREEPVSGSDIAYLQEWSRCEDRAASHLPPPSILGPAGDSGSGDDPSLEALEQLSVDYAAAALEEVQSRNARIVPSLQRLLTRLTAMRGSTPAPARADIELRRLALIAQHPQALAEFDLLGRCGQSLPGILTGASDPVTTVMEAPGLASIYSDSVSSRNANEIARDLLQRALEKLPADCKLRILEIGAGSGGTTASLLPLLPPDRTQYVFTDVSRAFLAKAKERFRDYPFVEYRTLDIESGAQTPESFDIVVAANVLHATSDVRATLAHVRRLLAPGGLLLMLEVVQPQRWLDLTFGLLEGWRKFSDLDLRPEHPLLSSEQWADALRNSGFEDCVATGAAGALRQAVILARAALPERPRVIFADKPARSRFETADLPSATVHALDAEPVKACAALLQAAQSALGNAAGRRPEIWLALGDPETPEAAAAAGLGRVLGLEHPELWGGAIHVSGDADPHAVLREIRQPRGPREIAIRGGAVLEPRLKPLEIAAAGPTRFPAEGSYLITGASGFLAVRLAEWMAARGARHLALVSRSSPPANVVAKLRVSGVRAEVFLADVGSASAMEEVFQSIALSMPPLRGVVHAAGRGKPQPLATLTPEDLAAEFHPKVFGAQVLHELTRSMPLDFFILCSSASSVWGAEGQAHYAAANAYLDALARQRRAMGLPALSVNWGLLSGGGMIDPEYRSRLERMGMEPLEPEEGLQAMFQLAASGVGQAVIARMNWKLFADVYQLREHAGMFRQVQEAAAPQNPEPAGVSASLRGMSQSERRLALRRLVIAEFCRTLNLDESDAPAPRQGFFDAGMDSLLAIEFRNRLQTQLGLSLPSTLAFNYPNAEALADWLETLLEPAPPVKEQPEDEAGEIARLFAGLQSALKEGRI